MKPSDIRLPLREAITKLEAELWGERPADEIRPQWDALYVVADRYEAALREIADHEEDGYEYGDGWGMFKDVVLKAREALGG